MWKKLQKTVKICRIYGGHFEFLNKERRYVIFFITTKQPESENMGNDTKIMFLAVLEQ